MRLAHVATLSPPFSNVYTFPFDTRVRRTDYRPRIVNGPGLVNEVDIGATDHTCTPPATHLWVGTAGTVVLKDGSGATRTLTAPAIGRWQRQSVSVIVRSGTGAGAMLVGWPE